MTGPPLIEKIRRPLDFLSRQASSRLSVVSGIEKTLSAWIDEVLKTHSDREIQRLLKDLRKAFSGFDALPADEKRRLAKKINTWSQREARRHYRIEDERDPRKDNWPTFDELLANNGDDCDGLDLIVYGLLLDFGFDPDRVYRAIVKRNRDRGNHMITLWFEDPHDPWVLDATGAMTFTMVRFSETEGWTPITVFNERVQFRALPSEETLSLNEN